MCSGGVSLQCMSAALHPCCSALMLFPALENLSSCQHNTVLGPAVARGQAFRQHGHLVHPACPDGTAALCS